jgi:hypothetical protein
MDKKLAKINGKEVEYDLCSEHESAPHHMGIDIDKVEYLGKGRVYSVGGVIQSEEQDVTFFWKLK